MPFEYGIICIFRDFWPITWPNINLHIFCLFQLNISLDVDFLAKNAQNWPYLSLKLLPNRSHQKSFTPYVHFSIFSFEILNMTSKLNLAVKGAGGGGGGGGSSSRFPRNRLFSCF